jgi:MYXO-CTERM domain-containing protein
MEAGSPKETAGQMRGKKPEFSLVLDRRLCALVTCVVTCAVAVAAPARATVLWDGDASKGVGVFKGLECKQGMVTVENDVAFGPVWKFFFPNGDTRCEVRGSKGYEIQQNTDIYVGWRVKYNVALGSLRYVFQMKGYPPPALQSNHPVVFATEQNNLVLINYDLQDKRHTIWQSAITRDQWLTVVLHMYMSKDPKVGFIEFWFNGVKQKFLDGSEKIGANTFDAGITDVKWGIYRGGQGAGDCIEHLGSPKIGTIYEDVAPGGGGGGTMTPPPPNDAGGAPMPIVDAAAEVNGEGGASGTGGGGPGAGGSATGGATGGGGSGGSPAAGGTGGASPVRGTGGAAATGGTRGEDPAPSSGGGCTTTNARDGSPAGSTAALALLLLLQRRRRAR